MVAFALLLPGLAAAQSPPIPVPIQFPKALVFPNYDNVHLGKDQALEGGAYVARTGDASANFYNPAGRTNVPLQFTTFAGGTTSVTTQPLPPFQYSARRVFNVSVGGNYKLGKLATLHGGFYTSMSPVANLDTSPLRHADLYGVTSGVDFQFEHFGASIGAGYEWGSAPSTPIGIDGQVLQGGNGVSLQSLSILYAISYFF